jgi:hypothetical protein
MSATPVVIAGGAPGDFLTARYLMAEGSQRQIGRQLAEAATLIHGANAAPIPADRVIESARRRWFTANYPFQRERISGIANYFGIDEHDPSVTLDALRTFDVPLGCSTAFYPRHQTAEGHGILARNMDFSMGTFMQMLGSAAMPTERPLAADPWIVELRPDHGYASIAVGIMDMTHSLDGINEAGLAVAVHGDDEIRECEPTYALHVGLAEAQAVRYLLETCATIAEAKEALLVAKHYYVFRPSQLVVADRSGASFVMEHSRMRNRQVIVEPSANSAGQLICTNHAQHRWPDPSALPPDETIEQSGFSYRRWRALADAPTDRLLDRDEIRARLAGVRFEAPVALARTFWEAIYNVDDSSVELAFFLKDLDGRSVYSEPLRFQL